MAKLIKNLSLTSLLVVGALTGCGSKCSHTGGEATCTALAVCEKCGEEYGELNVNNHTFVAGEVVKEATCTEDGEQTYNCACGATKTEVISSLGHSHSTEWIVGETTHWHECACGDKADEAEHAYTIEGEVTVAPQCTAEGKQEFACECGATIEVTLPSLGGHIDADDDFYCDREGCTGKVLKKTGSEVTIAWAIAACNANVSLYDYDYYVTGTVKEIHDNNNGILTITDGTNDLYINLIKGANGDSYSKLPQKAVVGDVIKLFGELKKDTSKRIPSMYGVTMEIVEHEHKFGEATCTKPATCECGVSTGEALGHISNDSDMLCDRCGFDTELTVAYLATATEYGMDNSIATTLRWTNETVYFSIGKGSGTMLYKTSADHARLYKNNTFTVYVTLPNQIHQITYHMPSTSNEDSLNKLSNIFKAEGHTPVVDTVEKSVTITVPGIDNVPFVNTSGSTLKITGVTVAYK